MVTYGSKLRAIRALFGLTQEQVAKKARLERRDIIKFEQNIALPTPQSKQAIEAALGIDLDAPMVDKAFQVLAGQALASQALAREIELIIAN